MAITMKTKGVNADALFGALNLDLSEKELAASGVYVGLGINTVIFMTAKSGIPVSKAMLPTLVSNYLKNNAKIIEVNQAKSIIKKAAGMALTATMYIHVPEEKPKTKPKTKAGPQTDSQTDSQTDLQTEGKPGNKIPSLNNHPIDLIAAEYMYQRVKGTNPNSIYRVVALGKDLNVAIRVSGDNMSVRVEGSALEKWSSKLEGIGFQVYSNRASTHMHADKVMRSKSIGAFITAIGYPFKSIVPNVDFLEKEFEKGK